MNLFVSSIEDGLASRYLPHRESLTSYYQTLTLSGRRGLWGNINHIILALVQNSRVVDAFREALIKDNNLINLLDSLCFLNFQRKCGKEFSILDFDPQSVVDCPEEEHKLRGLTTFLRLMQEKSIDSKQRQLSMVMLFVPKFFLEVFEQYWVEAEEAKYEAMRKSSLRDHMLSEMRASLPSYRLLERAFHSCMCPGSQDFEAQLTLFPRLKNSETLLTLIEEELCPRDQNLVSTLPKLRKAFHLLAKEKQIGPLLVEPPRSGPLLWYVEKSQDFAPICLSLCHHNSHRLSPGQSVDPKIIELVVSSFLGPELSKAKTSDSQVDKRVNQLLHHPLRNTMIIRCLAILLDLNDEVAHRVTLGSSSVAVKIMTLFVSRYLVGKYSVLLDGRMNAPINWDIADLGFHIVRCLVILCTFEEFRPLLKKEGIEAHFEGLKNCAFRAFRAMCFRGWTLLSHFDCGEPAVSDRKSVV